MKVGPSALENEADEKQIAVTTVADGGAIGPSKVFTGSIRLAFPEFNIETIMADGGNIHRRRAMPAEHVVLFPVQADILLNHRSLESLEDWVAASDTRIGVHGNDRIGRSRPLLVHPPLAPRHDGTTDLPGQREGGRSEEGSGNGGRGYGLISWNILGFCLEVSRVQTLEPSVGEDACHAR